MGKTYRANKDDWRDSKKDDSDMKRFERRTADSARCKKQKRA